MLNYCVVGHPIADCIAALIIINIVANCSGSVEMNISIVGNTHT